MALNRGTNGIVNGDSSAFGTRLPHHSLPWEPIGLSHRSPSHPRCTRESSELSELPVGEYPSKGDLSDYLVDRSKLRRDGGGQNDLLVALYELWRMACAAGTGLSSQTKARRFSLAEPARAGASGATAGRGTTGRDSRERLRQLSMQIQVLYFAVFRERLRTNGETLDLPANATVADAISSLASRHPPIAALAGRFRVAVNQEFATEAALLREGDELALIPPVAGGSDADVPYARVLDTELSLDRCLQRVRSPDAGGVVTFTGMVRRLSRGQTIDHLEYEAYGEMAVREMSALILELQAEVPGTKLAVEHRVGRLAVGDVAVVIAASAPHRAEAFVACRAMIDRLKDRVPIWKKETGVSGEEWIGLGP